MYDSHEVARGEHYNDDHRHRHYDEDPRDHRDRHPGEDPRGWRGGGQGASSMSARSGSHDTFMIQVYKGSVQWPLPPPHEGGRTSLTEDQVHQLVVQTRCVLLQPAPALCNLAISAMKTPSINITRQYNALTKRDVEIDAKWCSQILQLKHPYITDIIQCEEEFMIDGNNSAVVIFQQLCLPIMGKVGNESEKLALAINRVYDVDNIPKLPSELAAAFTEVKKNARQLNDMDKRYGNHFTYMALMKMLKNLKSEPILHEWLQAPLLKLKERFPRPCEGEDPAALHALKSIIKTTIGAIEQDSSLKVKVKVRERRDPGLVSAPVTKKDKEEPSRQKAGKVRESDDTKCVTITEPDWKEGEPWPKYGFCRRFCIEGKCAPPENARFKVCRYGHAFMLDEVCSEECYLKFGSCHEPNCLKRHPTATTKQIRESNGLDQQASMCKSFLFCEKKYPDHKRWDLIRAGMEKRMGLARKVKAVAPVLPHPADQEVVADQSVVVHGTEQMGGRYPRRERSSPDHYGGRAFHPSFDDYHGEDADEFRAAFIDSVGSGDSIHTRSVSTEGSGEADEERSTPTEPTEEELALMTEEFESSMLMAAKVQALSEDIEDVDDRVLLNMFQIKSDEAHNFLRDLPEGFHGVKALRRAIAKAEMQGKNFTAFAGEFYELALADSGTFDHIWGAGLEGALTNIHKVKPVTSHTANGEKVLDIMADLVVKCGEKIRTITGFYDKNLKMNLVSEGKLAQEGWEFYLTKKTGKVCLTPEKWMLATVQIGVLNYFEVTKDGIEANPCNLEQLKVSESMSAYAEESMAHYQSPSNNCRRRRSLGCAVEGECTGMAAASVEPEPVKASSMLKIEDLEQESCKQSGLKRSAEDDDGEDGDDEAMFKTPSSSFTQSESSAGTVGSTPSTSSSEASTHNSSTSSGTVESAADGVKEVKEEIWATYVQCKHGKPVLVEGEHDDTMVGLCHCEDCHEEAVVWLHTARRSGIYASTIMDQRIERLQMVQRAHRQASKKVRILEEGSELHKHWLKMRRDLSCQARELHGILHTNEVAQASTEETLSSITSSLKRQSVPNRHHTSWMHICAKARSGQAFVCGLAKWWKFSPKGRRKDRLKEIIEEVVKPSRVERLMSLTNSQSQTLFNLRLNKCDLNKTKKSLASIEGEDESTKPAAMDRYLTSKEKIIELTARIATQSVVLKRRNLDLLRTRNQLKADEGVEVDLDLAEIIFLSVEDELAKEGPMGLNQAQSSALNQLQDSMKQRKERQHKKKKMIHHEIMCAAAAPGDEEDTMVMDEDTEVYMAQAMRETSEEVIRTGVSQSKLAQFTQASGKKYSMMMVIAPVQREVARKLKRRKQQTLEEHHNNGHHPRMVLCDGCELGIMRAKAARRGATPSEYGVNTAQLDTLYLVKTDQDGDNYAIAMCVPGSQWGAVKLNEDRSSRTTAKSFYTMKVELENISNPGREVPDWKLGCVQVDHGTEFLGGFEDVCDQENIKIERFEVGRHAWLIESFWKQVQSDGAAIGCGALHSDEMRNALAGNLLKHACWLRNRRPVTQHQKDNNITPLQEQTGSDKLLSDHTRRYAWGSLSFVFVPKKDGDSKVRARAMRAIFVGYSDTIIGALRFVPYEINGNEVTFKKTIESVRYRVHNMVYPLKDPKLTVQEETDKFEPEQDEELGTIDELMNQEQVDEYVQSVQEEDDGDIEYDCEDVIDHKVAQDGTIIYKLSYEGGWDPDKWHVWKTEEEMTDEDGLWIKAEEYIEKHGLKLQPMDSPVREPHQPLLDHDAPAVLPEGVKRVRNKVVRFNPSAAIINSLEDCESQEEVSLWNRALIIAHEEVKVGWQESGGSPCKWYGEQYDAELACMHQKLFEKMKKASKEPASTSQTSPAEEQAETSQGSDSSGASEDADSSEDGGDSSDEEDEDCQDRVRVVAMNSEQGRLVKAFHVHLKQNKDSLSKEGVLEGTDAVQDLHAMVPTSLMWKSLNSRKDGEQAQAQQKLKGRVAKLRSMGFKDHRATLVARVAESVGSAVMWLQKYPPTSSKADEKVKPGSSVKFVGVVCQPRLNGATGQALQQVEGKWLVKVEGPASTWSREVLIDPEECRPITHEAAASITKVAWMEHANSEMNLKHMNITMVNDGFKAEAVEDLMRMAQTTRSWKLGSSASVCEQDEAKDRFEQRMDQLLRRGYRDKDIVHVSSVADSCEQAVQWLHKHQIVPSASRAAQAQVMAVAATALKAEAEMKTDEVSIPSESQKRCMVKTAREDLKEAGLDEEHYSYQRVEPAMAKGIDLNKAKYGVYGAEIPYPEAYRSERWMRTIKAKRKEKQAVLSKRQAVRITDPTDEEKKTAKYCRWVYTQKRPTPEEIAEGKPGRDKARLVATDLKSKSRLLQHEIYAAVPPLHILRIMLANHEPGVTRWCSTDFETAFLQSQGGGFIVICFIEPETGQLEFWRINGVIYGMGDAPKAWKETFVKVMEDLGFTEVKNAPSVFYHEERRITIANHVDDPLIQTFSIEDEEWILSSLEKAFKTNGRTYLTPSSDIDYLSVRLSLDEQGVARLDVRDKITNYLASVNMADCKPSMEPLKKAMVKEMAECDELLDEDEAFEVRSAIGQARYLADTVLVTAVTSLSVMATWFAKPNKACLKAVHHLQRWMQGAKDLCLAQDGKSKHRGFEVYSDADLMGMHSYNGDTRSRTGSVCLFRGLPVAYGSHLQKLKVNAWFERDFQGRALSSGESETYALSDTLRLAQWIMNIMHEVGINALLNTHGVMIARTGDRLIERGVTIRSDSAAAKGFVENCSKVGRMRHMDARADFVHDLRDPGLLKLIEFVRGVDNLADGFTKILTVKDFKKWQEKLLQQLPAHMKC